MLFKAEFAFMPLQDILQWIEMNQLSCEVSISLDNDSSMILYLENGSIIFATSRKRGNRLGESLVRAGVLNDSQLFRALNESREAGLSLTRYLVERALVSCESLSDHLAQLVETLLIEALSSKGGSATVATPLPEFVMNGPIHLQTGQAILNAARIYDERNRPVRHQEKFNDFFKMFGAS